MRINISDNKVNYSQRNNERDPLYTCNTTSMVMALCYLGYQFPKGKYKQPEDNLHYFITEELKLRPWVHAELSLGTNKWMGKDVTSFSTVRPIKDIFKELKNGKPVVLSGDFPGTPTVRKTPLGHIVVLVGAIWNKNIFLRRPTTVIIDDPYGDTLNDWKGSGNDIELSWTQFIDWFKPIKSETVKWGHFFKSPQEAIDVI